MSADLIATAHALVAAGKGILAADESTGTIKKRFDSHQVQLYLRLMGLEPPYLYDYS